jgi:GNAT superfamily N-acetyltransferase
VRAGGGLSPPGALLPHYQVGSFSCGQASLDDWLKRRALKSEGSSARTYVVCDGEIVVAYYCIATGAVERTATPKAMQRHGMPNTIPVMILGRLAVDRHYQGRGIGGGLLRDATLRVLHLSGSVGCAALLVHAIDQESAEFYRRYGFIEFPAGGKTLFLPLATVAAAL